jgi:hypothetical protein
MTDSHSETSASTRLKALIDSGALGDKAPGFDPAAAPLGVDDEAGGARPNPEIPPERADGSPNAVTPELAPHGRAPRAPAGMAVLVGVLAAAMLGLAYLLFLR